MGEVCLRALCFTISSSNTHKTNKNNCAGGKEHVYAYNRICLAVGCAHGPPISPATKKLNNHNHTSSTAGAAAAGLAASAAGLEFIYSQRGRPLLVVDNYLFRKNRGSYWRCIRCTKNRCKCRLILRPDRDPVVIEQHSHGSETEKITFGRKVKTSMSLTTRFDGAVSATASDGGDDDENADEQQPSKRPARNGSGAAAAAASSVADLLQVEPVQLWVRQPHFGTDEQQQQQQQYVGMVDDDGDLLEDGDRQHSPHFDHAANVIMKRDV